VGGARVTFWTEERTAHLKRLLDEKRLRPDLSFSDIGRALGCSRNSALSKAHRMGWTDNVSKRVRSHRQALRAVRRVVASPVPPPEPYVEPIEPALVPEKQRKALTDLSDRDCRWPVGDPRHADFHFCGARREPGISYCKAHAQRAFQAPVVARRESIEGDAKKVRVAEAV